MDFYEHNKLPNVRSKLLLHWPNEVVVHRLSGEGEEGGICDILLGGVIDLTGRGGQKSPNLA